MAVLQYGCTRGRFIDETAIKLPGRLLRFGRFTIAYSNVYSSTRRTQQFKILSQTGAAPGGAFVVYLIYLPVPIISNSALKITIYVKTNSVLKNHIAWIYLEKL